MYIINAFIPLKHVCKAPTPKSPCNDLTMFSKVVCKALFDTFKSKLLSCKVQS